MIGANTTRLAALEKKPSAKRQRVVRVVSPEGQEAEVLQLLLSQGIDPDADADDLFVIHRCIVVPDGELPYSEPPSILSVTGTNGRRRGRRTPRHEAGDEPSPRRSKRRGRKITEDGRSE